MGTDHHLPPLNDIKMGNSDSEDDAEEVVEMEYDGRSSEGDEINDEDLFDAEDNAEEGTERDEVSKSIPICEQTLTVIEGNRFRCRRR